MTIKIAISADLVPIESNNDKFENGNIDDLTGEELHCILKIMDFTAFNPKIPLTNGQNPIKKCGPNLIAFTSLIN